MKILLFLVVLVFGGLYLYVESQKVDFVNPDAVSPQEVVNENADEGETDFVPADSESSLLVRENALATQIQRPGKQVTVASVYLAEPGYVVIYADVEGEAKEILGSSELLNVGENKDVTISLTEIASDGLSLWAVLHAEKSSNDVFEAAVDTKVVDGMGESISSYFEIRADVDESATVTL